MFTQLLVSCFLNYETNNFHDIPNSIFPTRILRSITTFTHPLQEPQFTAPSSNGYQYCTTSFIKAWTLALRRFKSYSRRARDSKWWRSLTMAWTGNKAKRLLSVNHSAKQFIINKKAPKRWKTKKVILCIRISIKGIKLNHCLKSLYYHHFQKNIANGSNENSISDNFLAVKKE